MGRTIRVSSDVTTNRSDAPHPGNPSVAAWEPPAGAAGWSSWPDGLDVATKAERLGWPGAELVEIEGDLDYDGDGGTFTPRWYVMVDQRLVDKHGDAFAAVNAALQQGARNRYHAERAENPDLDHSEALDAVNDDWYPNDLWVTFDQIGRDHFESAGVVILARNDQDAFKQAGSSDIATFFDPEDFNPDTWRGVELHFPNGEPDRYTAADPSVWFYGYNVTATRTDGTSVDFQAEGIDDNDDLVGVLIDEDGEPTGEQVVVKVDDLASIEVP